MKVPIEISYHDVPHSEAVETLIRTKAEKLEQVCSYLSSCRVSVEASSHRHREGNRYHVRIDMTVPPGKELAVSRDPGDDNRLDDLPTAIRLAFEAARKQLKELVEKQHREVKQHPEQETQGVVVRTFPEEGYGFLRDRSGREIYFHRNSLLDARIEELAPGAGVSFYEHDEEGDDGPQASSVRVVDKLGPPVAST